MKPTDDLSKLTIEELKRIYKEENVSEALKALLSEIGRAEHDRAEADEESHIREVTSMDLPMDWENSFEADARARGVHADSPADALVLSLLTLGKVDIEFIAAITGEDCKAVIGALRGSIYQNPETWEECFYKGWETADEYLSGNLRRKRRVAEQANEAYRGYFADNLAAIDGVLPAAVPSGDIFVTLGSSWVPPDIIDSFISYLMSAPYEGTIHDEVTGTWEIPNRSALTIIERTLNMKDVYVTDEAAAPSSKLGKKRVVNKGDTVAAVEKQELIVREFKSWVWRDKGRKERLVSIFEDKFGCVRQRRFDGSFLHFPGMAEDVHLYPYQKDAVARIIFTPNTLLAHDVGAGKTYVMVAAGMELRRMGLSAKNLYVVPNNLVGQWKDIFLDMYPRARLLCIEPRVFGPGRRNGVLREVQSGDYDGIIIAYSCFEQIPLSLEFHRQQLRELSAEADRAAKEGGATSRLIKRQKDLKKKLDELDTLEALGGTMARKEVCFDELGITRLFVDEAHNFKNVPVETKVDSVLGIGASGSKKCKDMMDKVHFVQRQNSGRGVVFATGTPITNSLTDAFVMQQYLQSGELAMLGLQNFDSWIGTFAERVTDFEVDVDTSSYRLATRFARFHNLPELTALLSSIADFHGAEGEDDIPRTDGYQDEVIPQTEEFAEYLREISRRADEVRAGNVSRKDDNLLKITTDGRKAALDFRLVCPSAGFTYRSKVARCVEKVTEIYFGTERFLRTQVIFCDISTPKESFNLYSEIREMLVARGVRREEIAFVHEADTEQKREALFAKVRAGEVRVLLGSTFKLGLGVNIQDRLIAVHHLDVPWRPADMIQREGRILRPGNLNSRVFIFRYITEGSFDAYSWQLLETKARFIAELLSGSLTERSGSDIDEIVLSYAEVKALAIGNPLVKERVETANELARYITLQRKTTEARMRLEQERAAIPAQIARDEKLAVECEADAEVCLRSAGEKTDLTSKEAAEKRRLLREALDIARGDSSFGEELVLFEYRGFEIVCPAEQIPGKPRVFVRGTGLYPVDLGETEIGNFVRVDNFIDSIPDRAVCLREAVEELKRRAVEIDAELAKREDYAEKIETYRRRLEILDKKLGVKK